MKKTRRKPAASKSKGKSFFSRYKIELILGAVIGALAMGIVALSSGVFVKSKQPAKPAVTVNKPHPKEDKPLEKQAPPEPIKEEPAPPHKEEAPPPKKEVASLPPVDKEIRPPATAPRIAIIIDDIGQDKNAAERLLAIDAPINFAVLPYLPHSRQLADEAKKRGRVVMLHLPMESKHENYKPGPGALYLSQTDAQTLDNLKKDLAAVPGISGVNNHMGSRFTEHPDKMKLVLNEIKGLNLFFVDSLTSADSVAYKTAQGLGMTTWRRDVFLDDDRNKESVQRQLDLLIKRAKSKGYAVGIGHPHPETVEVLTNALPRLREKGVVMVPINKISG